MRARVDRVRYQKPLVGRVFPCSLSKTLGIVVTVVSLKNPGVDRVRSQKPWWGFVLTVFSLKNRVGVLC